MKSKYPRQLKLTEEPNGSGFHLIPARLLKVGQCFFFRRGGLRMRAVIVSEKIIDIKIVACKPNGVNYTRYVSPLKKLIVYDK